MNYDVPTVTIEELNAREAARVKAIATLYGGSVQQRKVSGRPPRPMKVINGKPHFRCSGRCLFKWLPASAFSTRSASRSGLSSRCRECLKAAEIKRKAS